MLSTPRCESNAQIVVSESLTDPQGIALDLMNNTMFITDTGSGQIVKADMGYKLMKAPILTNKTYFQARARAERLQPARVPR